MSVLVAFHCIANHHNIMVIYKKKFFSHLIAIVIGISFGLIVNHCARKPTESVKIVTDTVIVHDTVPDYQPTPVDSVRVKWVTRWLPSKQDTVNQVIAINNLIHDTVAVEVPITSKHYKGENYDAYVSGFEPNLDSIFVYNETQYITTTITQSKPPNKWELDAVAGIDYNVTSQRYTPYAGGELLYKPSRFQFGIRGGVVKADKVETVVGGVVKMKIF